MKERKRSVLDQTGDGMCDPLDFTTFSVQASGPPNSITILGFPEHVQPTKDGATYIYYIYYT